jgi:hypothetical protein
MLAFAVPLSCSAQAMMKQITSVSCLICSRPEQLSDYATSWMIEIRFQRGAEIFFSHPLASCPVGTESRATCVCEAENWGPHSVEVKNVLHCTSTPSFSFSSYLTGNGSYLCENLKCVFCLSAYHVQNGEPHQGCDSYHQGYFVK